MATGPATGRAKAKANSTVNKSTEESLIVESLSAREFLKEKGYNRVVPNVKISSGGVPYLTLVPEDGGKAENVYFSRPASEHFGFTDGDELPKGFFNEVQFTGLDYGEDELRWKVSMIGSGGAIDVEDLF